MFRSMLILSVCVLTLFAAPAIQAAPAANGFLPNCTGEYFNNITATGTPVMVRTDASINFYWPDGTSPGPGVATNNYSVRWTCSVYVSTAGTYTFTATTDDGMNVLLDGNLLIWAWYDQGPTAYATTTSVSAGWHTIKVEYYNKTLGGTAQVSSNLITSLPPPPPPPPVFPNWKGEYFNNKTLSGTPTITRNDVNLNFNWSTGSPDPSIPVDNFSVRWTRTLNFTGGTWRFTATTDDGVRLYIDGYLVIDRWFDQPPTAASVDVVLGAGNHAITMEYFESALYASASLTYAPAGAPPPPPLPPPGGEVTIDDRGPGWQAGGIGGWINSAFGVGNHSFWTYNNTYTAYGYNWARWYALLPAPGYYEVFAYIPDNLGTTLNARYWIRHNNRYDLSPRSQGFYHNQWLSLGTHYFNAAGGEYVSLADVTYECYLCRTVVFDAVKFVPR